MAAATWSSVTMAASAGEEMPPAAAHPLVVRQHAVHGELAGRHLAGGVGVVGDRHGEPGHDPGRAAPRRRPPRRAAARSGLDRPGVGHPRDVAAGQLAGAGERLGRQRRHQHPQRRVGASGQVGAAEYSSPVKRTVPSARRAPSTVRYSRRWRALVPYDRP